MPAQTSSLIDGQVHGDRTVAVVRRSKVLRVVARGRIGLSVPDILPAGRHVKLVLVNRMDGQVQRHNGVAKIGILESLIIIS